MIFSPLELLMIAIIFTWIGFVRTGLGFGGAVLGLPILMLIGGSPIDWLPIIGIHLLFFSSITLSNSLRQVDWQYLKKISAMDTSSKNYWCDRSFKSSTKCNDCNCVFNYNSLFINLDK